MKFRWWPLSRRADEAKMTTDQLLEVFKQVFGSNSALTGDSISLENAIRVSTVLACARVIANGISQVPLKLFRESSDGRSRVPAKEHPMYRLLHRRPNPWQTSFEFRQMLGLHLVLASNHYSFKNVVGGRIVELVPFEPQWVCPKRLTDGTIQYQVTLPGGKTQVFPAEVIWHVKGLSWSGWAGWSAIQLAREAIGLSIATERQHAQLHANGVSPSGLYSIEGKLDDKQHAQLQKWIKDNYSGPNSGLPMILDRGAKWLSQAMSGVDAQHLETRRHQVEEVCRALGVFPQMVGHSDKTSTFASAEAFFIAHVVHTLAPWYECIEQSIDVNLLSERDSREGYYAKFIEEGMLRGSMEATANMLDKYVNGGIMTPNEARQKLDMNDDADPASSRLRVPANIVGKDPVGDSPPDDTTDEDTKAASGRLFHS